MPEPIAHAYQPGEQPWCHFVVGSQLVRIAEHPGGATYQRVPTYCNRDKEDHPPQHVHTHACADLIDDVDHIYA